MPNFGETLYPPQKERNFLRRLATGFLEGKIPDHTGMFVDQYFNMTEAELESCHGWIQWAFPIDTVSPYNNKCGIFFKEDGSIIRSFYKKDSYLYYKREKLVELYLATIGIDLYAATDTIKFFQVVDSPYNHHMKRISRVLLHLIITGDKNTAFHLYKTLINDLVMVNPAMFTPETVAYWSAIVLEFDESTRKLL